jgi:hypothetical protein
MAALRTFIAWFAALATVLFVVEGGLRLVGLAPEKSPVEFDDELGWSNRRNASGVLQGAEFTAHWRTDALGLRETPHVFDTPAPNVVLLGDSFVFGTAVDAHDTIAAKLQAAWDADGVQLQAQNAGALGFDTGQAVRWFEQHGQALAPRAAVLFVYENDLYWNTVPTYVSNDGPRAKVRLVHDAAHEREAGAPLVAPPQRPWFAHTALGNALGKLGGAEPPPHVEIGGRFLEAELAPLAPSIRASELDTNIDAALALALQRFRTQCDALGVRAWVAVLPSAALFDADWRATWDERGLGAFSDWSPEAPIERVLACADDVGVATIDLSRALRAHADAHPSERLFHRRDWHLAPRGNEVVAQALAAHLGAELVGDERGRKGALEHGGFSPWMRRAAVFAVLTALVTTLLARQPRSKGVFGDLLGAAAMVGFVMTIVIGGGALVALLPPLVGRLVLAAVVVTLLSVATYHLRDRFDTLFETLGHFTRRGLWHLVPTLVFLLAIGSLLIVAASSPFVAPFVYTLF